MSLSEFLLNLTLASLLILISLKFLSTIHFHTHEFEQKITLEDTALKALLTLEQSIDKSSLSYCASANNILNHSPELDSTSRYQWQNNKLITYQKTKARYQEAQLSSQQQSLILPFAPEGPWLLLDDCNHAVLSTITHTTKITSNDYLITFNHPLDINLTPPIMIGILTKTQFKLNTKGLSRQINHTHQNLIYANIKSFKLEKNNLTLTAQDHDYSIEFKKNL